jgi:serine/threonine protein kinase
MNENCLVIANTVNQTPKLHKEVKFAVKILSKVKLKASANGILSLLKEIKVHWILEECEGILRLIEIYEDNQYVYLVLEYQRQGSLLGKLTQTQVIDE